MSPFERAATPENTGLSDKKETKETANLAEVKEVHKKSADFSTLIQSMESPPGKPVKIGSYEISRSRDTNVGRFTENITIKKDSGETLRFRYEDASHYGPDGKGGSQEIGSYKRLEMYYGRGGNETSCDYAEYSVERGTEKDPKGQNVAAISAKLDEFIRLAQAAKK